MTSGYTVFSASRFDSGFICQSTEAMGISRILRDSGLRLQSMDAFGCISHISYVNVTFTATFGRISYIFL